MFKAITPLKVSALYRRSYKSLARPGSKKATATKL